MADLKDKFKRKMKQLENKENTEMTSELKNIDSTYLFPSNEFEELFSDLDVADIQYLKDESIKVFTIFSKNYTKIGEILYNAQLKLATKKGAFLKWSEEVLGIKRQSAYNYVNRYELILQNPDSVNIIEALPIPVVLELMNSKNEVILNKVLLTEITDVKEIKEAIKNSKVLEHTKNAETSEMKDEVELLEVNVEEMAEITFFDIKNNISKVDVKVQNKVKKLLNEIEKLLKESQE